MEKVTLPPCWFDHQVIRYNDLRHVTVKDFTAWKHRLDNPPRGRRNGKLVWGGRGKLPGVAGDPAELRTAKKASGLTIKQIAETIGVSERMVSLIFAGKATDKMDELRRLLKLG